ncbi:unnamed protein product, partial [Tilletia caries]
GHEAYGSIPPTSPASLFRGPQATSAAASITVSPKLLVSQSYYQHLQQMANERRKLVAEVEMLRASTAPSLPPLGPSSSAPLMTNAGIRPGITSLSSTSGNGSSKRAS